MNAKDEFLSNWRKFIAKLKGRMLGMSRDNELPLQAISEILDREREFWLSRYEEGGRWIERFSEQDAARCDTIRNILAVDLQFSGNIKPKSNVGVFRIFRIAIGAVVGFLLIRLSPDSWVLKSEALLKCRDFIPYVSAGISGVVFYFLGQTIDASLLDKCRYKLIDSYLSQLEKYRLSIETLLDERGWPMEGYSASTELSI